MDTVNGTHAHTQIKGKMNRTTWKHENITRAVSMRTMSQVLYYYAARQVLTAPRERMLNFVLSKDTLTFLNRSHMEQRRIKNKDLQHIIPYMIATANATGYGCRLLGALCIP